MIPGHAGASGREASPEHGRVDLGGVVISEEQFTITCPSVLTIFRKPLPFLAELVRSADSL